MPQENPPPLIIHRKATGPMDFSKGNTNQKKLESIFAFWCFSRCFRLKHPNSIAIWWCIDSEGRVFDFYIGRNFFWQKIFTFQLCLSQIMFFSLKFLTVFFEKGIFKKYFFCPKRFESFLSICLSCVLVASLKAPS